MKTFLVTLKLDANPAHDPSDKKTGSCPADAHALCTDVTGQHHTVMFVADDELTTPDDVRALYALNGHVTRVEDVTRSLHMTYLRSEE